MKTFTSAIGLFFILAISLQEISAIPSPRRVIDEDGDKYNEDDCENSAKDAERSGACAVIFEQQECDISIIGDKLEIDEGTWTNLKGTGFNEDVESIIVKPGCVVFGYDEDDKKERGSGISVSAVGKTDWVYRELNDKFDLEDDIEAVECFCGRNAELATQILPLESKNILDTGLSLLNVGTATNYCNLFIYAFNRLPVEDRACAVLFESDKCKVTDGILFKKWYLEIKPNNKDIELGRFSRGAKKNSAESVLVRPGCTFTGFDTWDGERGTGAEVHVTSLGNSTRPRHFPFKGMEERIDAYKCTCE